MLAAWISTLTLVEGIPYGRRVTFRTRGMGRGRDGGRGVVVRCWSMEGCWIARGGWGSIVLFLWMGVVGMEWTGVFSVGLSYCCTCLSILWLRRFGNLVSVWFLYWDIMHGGGREARGIKASSAWS